MRPEILIALTTARGCQIKGDIGRSTGDRLNSLDIAFMQRYVSREEMLACRLAWAGDCIGSMELAQYVIKKLKAINDAQGWNAAERMIDKKKKPTLEELALLAVLTTLDPKKFKTVDDRASLLGVSKRAYQRTWGIRYSYAVGIISSLINGGIVAMKKGQRK